MTKRFKTISIGSEQYQLPLAGTSSPWGEELSDLIEAMVDSINTTNGAADITETSATIQNTSGAKDITGLAFDPAIVRSAEISYNITRSITKSISNIPTGTTSIQIDCTHKHNLFTGDQIVIAGSNSTPSINGTYTITKVNDNSFDITIAAPVTVSGNTGTFSVQLVESGSMFINYGQQGWSITRVGPEGKAFVDIDFTTIGQAQYNPTVLEGTGHSGLIKFVAKALLTT